MTLDALTQTLLQAQTALELLEQIKSRTRLTYARGQHSERLELLSLPDDEPQALARLFYAIHGKSI